MTTYSAASNENFRFTASKRESQGSNNTQNRQHRRGDYSILPQVNVIDVVVKANQNVQ